MTHLISAEALKLRSTRTPWGMALIAVVLAGAITGLVAGTIGADTSDVAAVAVSPGGIGMIFALLLGVLAVTTEHRHGTITATLLAAPDRGALLRAKLVPAMVAGLGIALTAAAASALIGGGLLASRGIETGMGFADWARMVLGAGVGGALFTAVGVGLGAVVRNQVGGVVGALAWLYVVEQLLAAVPGPMGETVAKYGLVGLSAAVTNTAAPDDSIDLLAQGPAALVLAGWAALLVTAGTLVMRRRDVS
jgi:ABC-2 type transport system permease protein